MLITELSELHIRKIERPGYVQVIVTHVPTGETVVREGENRLETKLSAYKELAVILTRRGL